MGYFALKNYDFLKKDLRLAGTCRSSTKGWLKFDRFRRSNRRTEQTEHYENKKIALYNVLTGENSVVEQSGAFLLFALDEPASFLFYRYRVVE